MKFLAEGGCYLAVVRIFDKTQLWETEACQVLKSMKLSSDPVNNLAWKVHTLTLEGRASSIVNHDV